MTKKLSTPITKFSKPGKGEKIAYWIRTSLNNRNIVFIHGYGSSKEHFKYAFSLPVLKEFTLMALDLPGFGQSESPADFEFSMKDQADVVINLLKKININSCHLCAHSMGGLVAMEVAEIIPEKILSLINLEGNLTIEDCFLSGKVAGQKFSEFVKSGRRKLEREFRIAGMKDPSMNEYAESFSKASSGALYKSAYHTVKDSSTPLIERFIRIKNTYYFYGEKNRGAFPAENLLLSAGIPVHYIENAGHAMAIENPKQLYGKIEAIVN